MGGIIFPMVMLAVTLAGGSLFLFALQKKKPGKASGGRSPAMQTAQEFINVEDIRGKYLYTTDGLVLTFVRIHQVNIDLYSKAEKSVLIR